LTRRQVVANDIAVQAQTASVPEGLSRFFGRHRELGQLRALLSSERLVTITGTGGVGKTRFAFELARTERDSFADGVWLVELALVDRPELVSTTIAESVRAPFAVGTDPLEGAAGVLAAGRQLLVLDNCEHLVAAAAMAARELLMQCPGLVVLTTSRQPLGAEGERVWRLSPLALPEPGEGVAEAVDTESVQFFCDRAQLTLHGEQLRPAQVADITAICRRVDGLPLALELAAAWVRILSLKQVVEHLDNSLGLAARDDLRRASRHRTMRAALDWSYELLTAPQRTALIRLSIFVGGFTLKGADAVLQGLAQNDGSALELVAALVDRSLVVADTSDDEARYHLLEPVRQYGAEMLSARSGDAELARAGCLGHLAALAEAAEEPILGGPDLPWLRRLDTELANIRSALGWGFEIQPETSSRLATALIWYCGFRDLYAEGRSWALRSMQTGGLLHARALHMAGWMSVRLGDEQAAVSDLEEASRLMAEGQWLPNLSMVLFSQSSAAYSRGDLEGMRMYAEEAVALAQQLVDDARIMVAQQMIALHASVHGDKRRALELWQELLVTARKRQSQWHITSFLTNIVDDALNINDTESALDALREGFESWALEAGGSNLTGVSYLIEGAGRLAIQRGDAATGLRLLSSTQAIRTRLQYRETPDEAAQRREWIEVASARAGRAAAEAASKRGFEMSADQGVAEARDVVASSHPRPETRERIFMFTDIVQSTELVGAIGDDAWHSLLDWHNRILREAFMAHHGEEIDNAGDGFFVAFDAGHDAASCAIDIQRTLAEHRRTHGFSPRVRIGLHATLATRSDSGYRGRGVHVAARIAALAAGDEILMSQGLIEQLRDGYSLAQSRPASLKGIAGPVLVAALQWRRSYDRVLR
jgi:predicted ATPase/class 3 adenylate cyclase